MKLFPKMELAVKAMALCCPDKKDESNKAKCDDGNKSPIARSEVFNETWMLRLTLALIHDAEGFEENSTLGRIHKAVKRRWISEGGLEPAFENEGPTWTDAILGDIELESDNDKESKSKRKVKYVTEACNGDSREKDVGVVVIEAKLGSDLDSEVTHSSDYNQVARSIACLAKLIKLDLEAAKKCSFVVFAPKRKMEGWKDEWAKNPVSGVLGIIQNQSKQRGKDHERKFRDIPNADDFYAAVASIQKHSKIMSWEEVIESMADDKTGAYETLKRFYIQTCDEYDIDTTLR